MEWQVLLLAIFSTLIVLMLLGFPVALSFIAINVVGAFIFFGSEAGLQQLIINMFSSLNTFMLVPIPMFILMGELMFHSGIALVVIDVVDKLLGRLPGRLCVLAVASGTILASLTGASMASVAVLGSSLVPEMKKRGYSSHLSMGSILASGGLAVMIPPSSLAVLVGAIGEISVGKILIAIIMPGLLMAILYGAYIITRSWLQSSIAPAYDVSPSSLSEKLLGVVRYVLPLGTVVFLVIGVIFLGIATPSEAAASGCMGILIVAALYRRLSWNAMKISVYQTIKVTGMILLIVAGASSFSQILSFSGAITGLCRTGALRASH
ncbi:TRAP transporter large permease subunit [Chloroflexota bacterium]